MITSLIGRACNMYAMYPHIIIYLVFIYCIHNCMHSSTPMYRFTWANMLLNYIFYYFLEFYIFHDSDCNVFLFTLIAVITNITITWKIWQHFIFSNLYCTFWEMHVRAYGGKAQIAQQVGLVEFFNIWFYIFNDNHLGFWNEFCFSNWNISIIHQILCHF